MMTLPIRHAALTALLGTALVACAGTQQDTQPSSAPAKSPPVAHAEPVIVQVAPPGATQDEPLMLRMRRPMPRVVVAPMQAMPRQGGPMLRMKRADGPRLGVAVTVTPDGLLVNSVDEGSLAQAAGVKEKDVLLRIGDEHVRDTTDIQHALRAFKPGDTVKVGVIRAGEGIVELQGVMPEPKTPPTPPTPPAPPAADGVKGGFLGVQMAEAADKNAASSGAGAPAAAGVMVEDVVPDSAAWFAGLQKGDHLLSVDGKALANNEDLVGAISGKEPGSMVELRYDRDGTEHTVQVRLGHHADGGPFGGMKFLDNPSGQFGMFGPGMPGMRLRLDDKDGNPLGTGDDDDDGGVFQFMQDPHHPFSQMFKGFDIGNLGPGSQQVQIQIENGKGTMTITRDGKTQTYKLDGNGNWVPQDAKDDTGSAATAPDDKAGTKPDDSTAPRVRNG